MSINDWKLAVAETREAYEHSEDIAFEPEREATTAFISSLECLTSAQAAEIAALQAKVEALTGALAKSREMLVVSFKEFSDCADADYFDRLYGAIKRCSTAITPEGE